MLKTLDATRTLNSYIGMKCAEVFLLKEEYFSIVCTHCDLKTFEFSDFLLHFKNEHLISPISSAEPDVHIKVEEGVELEVSEHAASQQPALARFAEFLEVPMTPMKRDSDSPPLSDCLDAPSPEQFVETKWSSHGEESEGEAHTAGECSDKQEAEVDAQPLILKKKTVDQTATLFKCKDCRNTYRFSKNLERHIKKCHSDGEYKCQKCVQVFKQERELTAHQRKEHNGYPCTHCDKVYKTKESLRVHEYNHTGVRNFVCNVEGCDKAFFNPKLLCIHKRVVHSNERNFICEICGYRTKKRSALVVHKRSHTGERPFVCKVCGKGFASQSLLCEHKPIHSTERPHKCDVCGAAFSRSKALYHHKHLHLGIKKFVCKLCGRAYAQMAGLAGHMRQHKAEQF